MDEKIIFDFQDNDNYIIALNFNSNLAVVIKTWDNRKYQIDFFNCCKLELNSEIDFEIGSICIKSSNEFNTNWEEAFIKENTDFSNYSEILFYDAWQFERINLRIIFENLKITEIN